MDCCAVTLICLSLPMLFRPVNCGSFIWLFISILPRSGWLPVTGALNSARCRVGIQCMVSSFDNMLVVKMRLKCQRWFTILSWSWDTYSYSVIESYSYDPIRKMDSDIKDQTELCSWSYWAVFYKAHGFRIDIYTRW